MTISYGNIGSTEEGADLRVAEVANPLVHMLLVDTTDLFPVGMVNLGDGVGSGSTTDNIAQLDLDDAMTAPTEGSAVSATAPATSSVQVSVARQALRYDITDLFAATGAPGMAMSPEHLAMGIRNAAVIRRTALVTALFGSVSNSVGTTTVDMDMDDFHDAIFQLNNTRNRPPYFACLYPQQANDLATSARGEGGIAAQFEMATGDLLGAKGPGYFASYLGVEIYTSDQVATANGGADSAGCMWSRGAFGYKENSALQMLGAAGVERMGVPGLSPVWIEAQRSPASGLTTYVGNYYVGVVEIEDARAVAIITDR